MIAGLTNKNIHGEFYNGHFGPVILSKPMAGWAIAASRTACVELGGVHFSAVPVAVSGQFSSADKDRLFLYAKFCWSFGDALSGTWLTDGKSKNQEFGPEAGHVFRIAGSYTVRLFVTVGRVETEVASATITVTSADIFFAGANTVCFSNTADFTGAPSGSTQVTTSSWNTAIGYIGSGKRLMFKCGDTFDTSSTVNNTALLNTSICAFGSGAKPIVQFTGNCTAFDLGYNVTYANRSINNTVADLVFVGRGNDAAASCNPINLHNYNEHFTLTGCDGTIINTAVYSAFDELVLQQDITQTRYGMVFEDCHWDQTAAMTSAVGGNMLMYSSGLMMSVIGCSFKNSGFGSHLNRFYFMQHGCIRHNIYTHASTNNRHSIKLHSCTWHGYANDGSTQRWNPKTYQGFNYPTKWFTGKRSEYVSIGENKFDSLTTTANYVLSIAPQDNWAYEEVSAVVVSNNYFNGANAYLVVNVASSNTAVRNNVFNGYLWSGYDKAISIVEPSQYIVQTVGVEISKNTFYGVNSVAGAKTALSVSSGGSEFPRGVKFDSNLIYALPKDAQNKPITVDVDGETALPYAHDDSGNVFNPGSYPFTGSNPPADNVLQFTLAASGAGADVGDF